MAEKEKIQELPEGWETLYIRNKAILEYGEGLPEEKRKEGDVPVYGSNGIVGYHDNYLIKGPGIIIGRKGTVGAVNFTTENYWPIDTAYYIRFIGVGDNIKWFYYYLTTLNLTSLNSATGVPGLNRGDVYDLKIKCPPLPEQRVIASILSTCDEAIEKTDAKIEKLKSVKQGLMQDLFRFGIDENGKMRSEAIHRFKDSPLGRIPEEWEVVNIFDVCKLINGRAFKPSEWSESGLPIIRIENLNNYEAEFNYCNFRVAAKHLIFKGDLLISWSGTPGTSFGIFEWGCGEAVLNQHIFKVILGSSIEKKYFYYSYINLLDEMIRQSHGGVGLQHITKEDLKRLRILLPKKPEQSRIACVLSSADEAIEKEEAYKNKLFAIKRGLMEDLLSGKVRVNKLIREAA